MTTLTRSVRNLALVGWSALHGLMWGRGSGAHVPALPERWFGARALKVVAPAQIVAPREGPLFALLMPICDPAPDDLARALESVQAQTYQHWRLICADDASRADHVRAQVRAASSKDHRIRGITLPTRGGIATTTERARAHASALGASWLVFMDHDDVIMPDALARLAAAIAAAPDVALLYTDECKVDSGARLFDAAYKPAWSPALLLGQNYINHLTAIRADVVAAAGGLRAGFDGAQDLDLLLRVSERLTPGEIGHVPAITYAWRHRRRSGAFSQSRAHEAAQAALRATQEALARRGVQADVTLTPQGWRKVSPHLPDTPLVSVIIPTRDGGSRFAATLNTALTADWPALEILVVDHAVTATDFADTIARANTERPTRALSWTGPFNYAAMMNEAVAQCRGELILLLNDDVSAHDPAWLATMAGWMAFADVGAVGPTLLYPSGLIQHAGLALGIADAVGSPCKHQSPRRKGPFGRLTLTREVAAVTGACLLTRKQHWVGVGGMDSATFPVAFNDVDYCLKLWSAGKRVIWTPDATMTHHEGATRGRDLSPVDAARLEQDKANLRARWGAAIADDPFYHPVWSRRSEDLRAAALDAGTPHIRVARVQRQSD